MSNKNEFRGLFETHVTVSLRDDQTIEGFNESCHKLGVKPIFIQLPSGRVPMQPMTASDFEGTLTTVKADAYNLVRSLEELGYIVVRIKIEASPFNEGLPQSNEEANRMQCSMYFEYHVKVLLDDITDLLAREVCCESGAHLSRNAFKVREDGLTEKFVTLRMYGKGIAEAKAEADSLMSALTGRGLDALKSVLEYCVFDTDSSIDEDWLDI